MPGLLPFELVLRGRSADDGGTRIRIGRKLKVFLRPTQDILIAIGKWGVFKDQKAAGIRAKLANRFEFCRICEGFWRFFDA